jgi:hypothetical protein
MWNRLRTSKTFWTAIGGIITTLGLLYGDLITLQEAGAAIFVAVQTIFLRDGQATSSGN